MAKGKTRYYKKKRPLPKWSINRKKQLIFRNKSNRYFSNTNKRKSEQQTNNWKNQRQNTIRSSIVSRACNLTENLVDYYHVVNCYTSGRGIEEVVLKVLSDVVRPGHQIFCSTVNWLSATPDGFTKDGDIPVEVKTCAIGNVRDVILKNYHQLQFSILCADKPKIILISYIFSNKCLDIVEVYRDQSFIESCLLFLEYAFFKYVSSTRMTSIFKTSFRFHKKNLF